MTDDRITVTKYCQKMVAPLIRVPIQIGIPRTILIMYSCAFAKKLAN